MVDVIIAGESGKLHAVYHKSEQESAPLAVVLSGSPRQKCHMNDRISYAMFRAFMDIGFSVVRFNYRGVNDSEGAIGTTADNMLDIATVV
ncbi:MAG: alpha/beta hydrolase, partial [Alphaproteobacteria bacterium]|nr:alpha/beta hydrolase [Alphaproteobacteria bacterium]